MKKAYLAFIGMVIGSVLTLAATYGWFRLTHPTGSVYTVISGRMVQLDPYDEYVQTVKIVADEFESRGMNMPSKANLSIDQGYERFITYSNGEKFFDLVYHNGLDSGDAFLTTINVYTVHPDGRTREIKFQGNSGIEVNGKPTTFPERKDTAIDAARYLVDQIKLKG
jgi:hypothetical protein